MDVRFVFFGLITQDQEATMAERRQKFMTNLLSPVHRELKIKAAKTGKTLHQVIEEIIEKSLEEQGYGSKLRRRTRA
jgi:predicted HicB family RNase H-like nuclease